MMAAKKCNDPLPVFFCLILVLLATACQTKPIGSDLIVGPSYEPTNIYRSNEPLPVHLKQVAVLPLATTTGDSNTEFGKERLEPLLFKELNKTGRFELLRVSPQQLKEWTGGTAWTGDEKLPANFLKMLRQKTGCDGVVFSHLTYYKPFEPQAIGWRLKLVNAHNSPEIIWAADELFDAGTEPVMNAARRYYKDNLMTGDPLSHSKTILTSPSQFAQYTLQALLTTLPAR